MKAERFGVLNKHSRCLGLLRGVYVIEEVVTTLIDEENWEHGEYRRQVEKASFLRIQYIIGSPIVHFKLIPFNTGYQEISRLVTPSLVRQKTGQRREV